MPQEHCSAGWELVTDPAHRGSAGTMHPGDLACHWAARAFKTDFPRLSGHGRHIVK